MSNGIRLIMASLISPLIVVPAFIFAGMASVTLFGPDADDLMEPLEAYFMVSIIALTIAYPVTLILGVPAVIVLEKYNRLSLFSLNVAGWLGAFCVSFMFDTWLMPFLFCCYLSSAITSTFWLIFNDRGKATKDSRSQPVMNSK